MPPPIPPPAAGFFSSGISATAASVVRRTAAAEAAILDACARHLYRVDDALRIHVYDLLRDRVESERTSLLDNVAQDHCRIFATGVFRDLQKRRGESAEGARDNRS